MVPKLAKREVGLFVGSLDGSQVGEEVGSFVGSLDGSQVGQEVGLFVGSLDGSQVGKEVGLFVGSLDGSQVGEEVGLFVGIDCMRLRLVRPLGTGADRHTSQTSFLIMCSPDTNWKALEVVLK